MAERKVQDRPVAWKRRLPLILLLPLALALQWLAARSPGFVERAYSREIYPLLARAVSALTGWIPFALTEVVLVLFVLGGLLTGVAVLRRVLRKRRSVGNLLLHGLINGLALSGLLYAWGLLFWGLNYQRQPFAVAAGLDSSTPTATELASLSRQLIVQAGNLRGQLAEDDDGVMRLRGSASKVFDQSSWGFRRIGLRYPLLADATVGPPKRTLFSSAVSHLGLRGVYLMHTSEPTVNTSIPDSELPITVCHELAHQSGFAREEEANFVGYLACAMHPDVEFQYSAALEALTYTLGALSRADPETHRVLLDELAPGVRRDRNAQRAFWKRYETPVKKLASRVNDTYLKSQGQEEGVGSYGKMVDLLVADRRAYGDPPTGE